MRGDGEGGSSRVRGQGDGGAWQGKEKDERGRADRVRLVCLERAQHELARIGPPHRRSVRAVPA